MLTALPAQKHEGGGREGGGGGGARPGSIADPIGPGRRRKCSEALGTV